MVIIRDNSRKEKYIFRCPCCKFSQTVCCGSFFEESRLSVAEILYVTFCWAAKIPPRSAAAACDVGEKSISQWYKFLREKCSDSLIQCPNYTFGGPGVVVQIDECLVAKRKYHVGRNVPQQWVFGLYNTTSKLGHIELVDD